MAKALEEGGKTATRSTSMNKVDILVLVDICQGWAACIPTRTLCNRFSFFTSLLRFNWFWLNFVQILYIRRGIFNLNCRRGVCRLLHVINERKSPSVSRRKCLFDVVWYSEGSFSYVWLNLMRLCFWRLFIENVNNDSLDTFSLFFLKYHFKIVLNNSLNCKFFL